MTSQPDTDSSTPIPWRVRVARGDPQSYRIENERTEYIAEIDGRDGPPDENEANAAFIVRAVNNHDKLLLALKWAIAYCPTVGDIRSSAHTEEYKQAYRNARTAITEVQS